MDLISGINTSGLYAEYATSAEKDNAGNVITATYMKDVLFDFTDSDEISGYNGSAFATPAELSAGINTKIENNIIDVKNVSCSATGSGNIALGTSSIADGKNSFVYGLGGAGVAQNIASGDHSIILGWHSKAIGRYSTVLGGNYCLASADVDPNYKPPYSGGPVAQGLGTSSLGHYTHSEGVGTVATNEASHAEGRATSSLGIVAHAEGDHTLASGNASHAEGDNTWAIGEASHAEGYSTYAKGRFSHAEGRYTTASGDHSHAEGVDTETIGDFSHAEGYGTIAGSEYMHVAGTYNKTSADALYVIGNGTDDDARSDAFIVYANGSVSAQGKISANGVELGATPPALSAGTDLIIENNIISVNTNGTANSADMAFVEGSATLATGKYSHAEGGKTSAIGTFTHAEGTYTKATGEESHAEGWGTLASGHNSHAEGNYTTACGSNSHAEGYHTLAYYDAHAEGDSTSALGQHSHAEGQSTITNNNCAHAEGQHTSAISFNSHAEGAWTLAQNNCAHAEGNYTSALGYASHTEGYETSAAGMASHAEGYYASALSDFSHAEGGWTVANNKYSHAEGQKTSAIGYNSHAEGYGTIASGEAMHAGGMCNKTSSDALFVIGNGSAETARSDAFIVTSGGLASAVILATSGISDVESAINSLSSNLDSYVPLSAIEVKIGSGNDAISTAFAQGSGNSAQSYAFTQGESNYAFYTSLAQGYSNSADYISMAQGTRNYASDESFAQGRLNSASFCSVAQGYDNDAYQGQAFGLFLKISGGMAIGYSNETTAARFVIGNGDRSGITRDTVNKADLFVIDADGNVSSKSGYFYDKDGLVGAGIYAPQSAFSSLSSAITNSSTLAGSAGINIVESGTSAIIVGPDLNSYVNTADMTAYATTAWVNNSYCRTTAAQALANYVGGNGITVAGDVYTVKTIASNLTEIPLQDGTGIHVYTDPNDEYVEIAAKPEVLLYQTDAPTTRNSDGIFAFNLTTFNSYNTKNGDVAVDNSSITGLNSNKLYNYNVKVAVTATTPSTVCIKGPNWNSVSQTSAYINTVGTLELDCYVKNQTSLTISGVGLSNVNAGVVEVTVSEICDV